VPPDLAAAVWQQRDKLAALVPPAGAGAEAAAAIHGAVHAAFVAGYRWIMAASAALAVCSALVAYLFLDRGK